ncbi:MAG: AAA family ATPase [Pseudomonadota bacterium]
MTTAETSALVEALARQIGGSEPSAVIETHISWILLTGTFAYKIKKPLNLGFLDFSSLDKRLHACREEVRLNRRLAPDYYIDVVPITGRPEAPSLEAGGEPIEYAVKMRQFPPDATLDQMDSRGGLDARRIASLAARIGRFHAEDCAIAGAETPWGTPEQVWEPIAQNFAQIAPLLDAESDRALLERLQAWTCAEHARLIPAVAARKAQGFIREAHGDLHLGNLAWVDDRPLVFDCLEFNPALRWIDIVSDTAFCYMDLVERGHPDWAWLFVNTWAETTGDYDGLALLRYYAVYRALVRAKVAGLRAHQITGAEQQAARQARTRQLQIAESLARPPSLRLDITHGLSGSGKTTVTHDLMQKPGAIRLRSDVERKRLAGMEALARSGAGIGQALYSGDATQRTYAHLAQHADQLLAAGWPVIVDATFTARWQRARMRDLAQARNVPFHILDFQVPVDILRTRIRSRAQSGNDASEANLAVLEHQLATEEPLANDERVDVIPVNALGDIPEPSHKEDGSKI